MHIAIDSDIPMPEPGSGSKYPFLKMEVGQSFFAPEVGQNTIHSLAKPAKSKGRKFSTRTVTENGVKGIRCWRVA